MAPRSARRPGIVTSTSVAPAAAAVSSARFTTSLTASISGWPSPKALRSTPMRACARACGPAAPSEENCAAANRALVPWSASTDSSAAASATDRASGPIVSCRATSTSVPSCETTSGVVRIPTRLQKEAGTRNRATAVGAQRDGGEVRRDRRGRSGARPARIAAEFVGVLRVPGERGVREPSGGEVTQSCFPQHDGSRRAQPPDHLGVRAGQIARGRDRAEGGGRISGLYAVLDQHRDAVQRAGQPPGRRQILIEFVRPPPGLIAQVHDRVQLLGSSRSKASMR